MPTTTTTSALLEVEKRGRPECFRGSFCRGQPAGAADSVRTLGSEPNLELNPEVTAMFDEAPTTTKPEKEFAVPAAAPATSRPKSRKARKKVRRERGLEVPEGFDVRDMP